ncbi:MAG: hypothetical protein ACLTNK_03230 [Akkermansia muciniphila]
MSIGGKQIDFVSSVPSNHGESIVMRILDKSALRWAFPSRIFQMMKLCSTASSRCRTALSW